MSRMDAIAQNGNTGEHYQGQFWITTDKRVAGTRDMLVIWPNGQKDQAEFEQRNNCRVIRKEPA